LITNNLPQVADPLKFSRLVWPGMTFYLQQQEIVYSVMDNRETIVVAANKMGKDFVAAFIVLWFFLTRHPCRIVTTSAKDDHLRVLWGEMGNLIQSAEYPLDVRQGGCLNVNARELRKVINGQIHKLSYCIGMVASQDKIAAMQGHHIASTGDGVPRTLFVCDEASSVPHQYYIMADTWMDRALIFGNAWPCDNFFKYAVKGNPMTRDPGGDLSWPDFTRLENSNDSASC
jgi:hypothetical protein